MPADLPRRDIEMGGIDAHIFPYHDKKKHTVGAPHACRCEPTVPYVEVTADGAIWRRIIRHGRIAG